MTYAPVTFKSKSAPNNFGGIRNDSNRIAFTGVLGNNMQTQDATTSPVTSPLSNVDAVAGQILTVPQGAVKITVLSTVACQIGEDSSLAFGFSLPANTVFTFDVSNQQYVYLLPSNGTNTINFYFTIV